MTRARAGSTLVELLTALPLMAIATGAVLLILAQAAHDGRLTAHAQGNTRERRHARQLLQAELAPLAARDLVTVHDTVLEFWAAEGVALLCAIGPGVVEMAPAPGERLTAWMDGLRAGDQVIWWSPPAALGETSSRVTSSVTAAPVRLPRGPCGGLETPRWQLGVRIPTASGWAGSPLLVQRLTRYVHYRSGAAWWLGRRTRSSSGWEVVQPVFGPLASPAHGGMRLAMRAHSGAAVASPESAAVLSIGLRTAAPPFAAHWSPRVPRAADTMRIDLALRAESWGRGR